MLLVFINSLYLLNQEISELQFELEYRESSSMYSQQTWAERFDR